MKRPIIDAYIILKHLHILYKPLKILYYTQQDSKKHKNTRKQQSSRIVTRIQRFIQKDIPEIPLAWQESHYQYRIKQKHRTNNNRLPVHYDYIIKEGIKKLLKCGIIKKYKVYGPGEYYRFQSQTNSALLIDFLA